MLTIMGLVLFFTLFIASLFVSRSAPIWLALLTAVLIFLSFFTTAWIVVPLWFLLITVTALLYLPTLRYQLMTKPTLKYLRKHLPTMSKTEQEALEAGDVWIEREFFCGRPDWDSILSFPVPLLTEEEQSFINLQTEHLCRLCSDWEVNQQQDLSPEAWAYIKQEGFWGLVIPKEYGGKGFSALAHSTIITKLSSRSSSAAVTVMVPNSLGPGELILEYGTEEQKKYYLPRLASGEEIPCFALTGPDAGSDAASIADEGIVCEQLFNGKKTLGIRLTWDKRYITLAPVATLLGLAFKLYDPEHLVGEVDDIGITLALVPVNTPGVEIGSRHRPMNLAFMNGPTRGKDVFIPLDYIIGGQAMMGKGWRMLMECLSVGRSISIPAIATSCSKLAIYTTGAYARVRNQFKMPIGYFDGIETVLGKMGGSTYIAEATRLLTANAVNHNIRPSLASAIAKYHLSELGRQVVSDAMDIHGGRGIQFGPRNYLGFLYQGTPVSITVEGANILTRNLIIFGQGAMRCHPFVRREMMVAHEPDSADQLQKFDQLLMGHIKYTAQNFARTLVYGLTGGYFVRVPKLGILSAYLRQLTRMSSALAFVSDMAMMLLGGQLKRKESLSARLGDVLSYLYMSAAVVKYFQDHQAQANEVDFVRWSLQYSLHKIQLAFDDFFSNFPIKGVGGLLRWIVYPVGLRFRPPSDHLNGLVAKMLLEPTPLRQRLCQYIYVGTSDDEPVARIDNAFHKVVLAESIDKKIREALKQKQLPHADHWQDLLKHLAKNSFFSAEEIETWRQAQIARDDAIAVDEFVTAKVSEVEKRTTSKV